MVQNYAVKPPTPPLNSISPFSLISFSTSNTSLKDQAASRSLYGVLKIWGDQALVTSMMSLLSLSVCIIVLSFGEWAWTKLTLLMECQYREFSDAGYSTEATLAWSSLASLLERLGEAYKVLPPVAAVFFVFYTGPNKNAFRIVAVTFGI